MSPERRDELGRIAYKAFREQKPHYPAWEELEDSCREANRAAAVAAYMVGWDHAWDVAEESEVE